MSTPVQFSNLLKETPTHSRQNSHSDFLPTTPLKVVPVTTTRVNAAIYHFDTSIDSQVSNDSKKNTPSKFQISSNSAFSQHLSPTTRQAGQNDFPPAFHCAAPPLPFTPNVEAEQKKKPFKTVLEAI